MPKIFHTGEYLYIEDKGVFPSRALSVRENTQGGVPRLDIVWTAQPDALPLMSRQRPERISRADGTSFTSILEAASYLRAELSAERAIPQSSSFYFNGVDQYINLGRHDDLFEHSEPFTVAAWVFTRDPAGVIASQGYGGYTGSDQSMILGVQNAQALAGVGGNDGRSSVYIADGHWHHLSLAYNPRGGAAAWRLYVDGANIYSYGRGTRKRNADLLIGATRNSSTNTGFRDLLRGNIDELVITTDYWEEADLINLMNLGVNNHPRLSDVECWLRAEDAKSSFPQVNNLISGKRIQGGAFVNGLVGENIVNFGIKSPVA